jgi:hypothetical protein
MKNKAELRSCPKVQMLRKAPDTERGLGRTSAPVVGRIVDIGPENIPVVEFRLLGKPRRLAARSTITLTLDDVGREAVLMFERNIAARPIIMGLLQTVAPPKTGCNEVDGYPDNLVFNARQEIKFSCGKASVVLTRAGKILLKGAYLLSRSSGVNRIKGGSVQIN